MLVSAFATAAAPAAAHRREAGSGGPLADALTNTNSSLLEPAAFFVSWHGVITLAYRGFPPALVDLKARLAVAHPGLPPERPGSLWPKTSLGALRDGAALSREQLAALLRICAEESAASFGAALAPAAGQWQQQQQGGGRPLVITVDMLEVALYECRSQERVLSCQQVWLQPRLDEAPPSGEEQARVAGILAEPDHPGYYEDVSREGGREGHYRGTHLGVTLVHPIAFSSGAISGGPERRPALKMRGLDELSDRGRLLAAVQRLRARVEEELPGLYAFFSDSSLHVTLRAVI
eukprot:scaffold4.g4960.t1